MTEPERPQERPDDIRFPDPRPLRRIQLATAGLLVVGIIIALTSGSRPAEVRWGTLVGVVALTVVVYLATRRRRSRRASGGDQNTRNTGEIDETPDERR